MDLFPDSYVCALVFCSMNISFIVISDMAIWRYYFVISLFDVCFWLYFRLSDRICYWQI
uniref:Vip3 n=1 Tax=Arundo donax TaxID=35708 RepID=A0A0A9H4C6_ARUDO